MKTKLISITKPEIEGINNAEELIVYCARVSNPSNQMNMETAPKLLSYLIKHKHWSPFEMVTMNVEIKTSRAIAAQILRHRSFSFQEFSQRYASTTGVESIEWRLQGKTNRQVGDDIVDLSPELKDEVDTTLATCKELYDRLINKGIAKECARMVLPLNTSTTIYMSGTVRSWIHYLQIRCDSHAQLEHVQVAIKIRDIFSCLFPNITKAINLCQIQ